MKILLFCLFIQEILSASGTFDYFEQGGDWGDLCSLGQMQSPIDIPTCSDQENGKYLIETRDVFIIQDEATFENVTVTTATSTVIINEAKGYLGLLNEQHLYKQYDTLQFHFHSPSEHTVDGALFDLELHIVHQQHNQDRLGVLGIFFDVQKGGNQNNQFIEQLDLNETDPLVSQIQLHDLVDSLDFNQIYTYQGSLTTPPCTEIVTWMVVNDPQPISTEQLQLFQNRWSSNESFAGGYGNNREIQSLNMRNIYKKSMGYTFVYPCFIAIDIFFIVFAIIGTVLDLTKTLVFYKMEDINTEQNNISQRQVEGHVKQKDAPDNEELKEDNQNIEPSGQNYNTERTLVTQTYSNTDVIVIKKKR